MLAWTWMLPSGAFVKFCKTFIKKKYFTITLFWSVRQWLYTGIMIKIENLKYIKILSMQGRFLHKRFLQINFHLKYCSMNKMDCFCDVCDKTINIRSKRRHLQPPTHKAFEKRNTIKTHRRGSWFLWYRRKISWIYH